jgi:hypothetical protein
MVAMEISGCPLQLIYDCHSVFSTAVNNEK